VLTGLSCAAPLHDYVRVLSAADLPFNETCQNYAERVVWCARRLVLPLVKKNRMLSARLAWSRLAVHVMQLLNWAFQEVKAEMLPLYVGLAWDLLPLLSGSCSSHTLQGACCVLWPACTQPVHTLSSVLTVGLTLWLVPIW
jgi:hypothetical protein